MKSNLKPQVKNLVRVQANEDIHLTKLYQYQYPKPNATIEKYFHIFCALSLKNTKKVTHDIAIGQ